jgi:hypothetical protein
MLSMLQNVEEGQHILHHFVERRTPKTRSRRPCSRAHRPATVATLSGKVHPPA